MDGNITSKVNNNRRRGLRRLLIVFGLLACAAVFTPVAVMAMEVDVPYNQTFTNSSSNAGADNNFDYQITAADAASPMPSDASGGVYYFSLKGTASGNLALNINYTKPGYYHYTVKGNVASPKEGYTYDNHVYTMMIMVVRGSNGLQVGAITIQDEDLAKYDSLQFKTGYTAKPAAAGGGNAGGGAAAAGGAAAGGVAAAPGPPDGNPPGPTTINSEDPPLVNIDGDFWSLPDMILMLLTMITSIIAILLMVRRRRNIEEDEGLIKRNTILRGLEAVPAIFALILFLVTQDMSLPMGWFDEWTIWFLIICIVNLLMALISRKVIHDDENQDPGSDGLAESMS